MRGGGASADAQEAIINALEKTGDFKVFRRLKLQPVINEPDGSSTKRGLFVDVETTGLNPRSSQVIELAMVPFDYAADGTIYRVHPAFQCLNEPDAPISSEISRLTGITDEMVAGQKMNVDSVEAFAKEASLIIAHNAAFDRPFMENIAPLFREKAWACSMSDIDWKQEGIEGRRLGDLLACYRLYFDGHRAEEDCQAGIILLSKRLPLSGGLAMNALLQKARTISYRLIARGAPYERKEALKSRGYRWNSDKESGPRAWWIEVDAECVESELAFLETEIMREPGRISIEKITAYERYSQFSLSGLKKWS